MTTQPGAKQSDGDPTTACLHPDDLIDDHELSTVDEDRLAHEGIADQLDALVRAVKTPSNIALYGPWGSGKSGIANLLKSKIDEKDGIRFARFDAFKYAELPFRRNFVSAVATELGHAEPKYHEDLYNGRTKTDIRVPAATIAKILGIFALLILGLSAILLVLVAIVATIQKGDFEDSFKSLAKAAVLAGLAPAALLSGLVALASKTFQVDRSVAKPESDEQFEELFKALVADSKAERLVIFVDELDRCSASEVVATLDTVRTFLGVKKCVFVIAADQQVLEEALTRAARQETPVDDANPYYSTGSAYLDKVFQYQISLPPLLSQSVNRFATTLVRDRGGLWADINAEYVVSVLIPTHVASPRRVKHLLNTFALTYRLAEERHRNLLLAENPRTSAAAIARLACLRVEFPLFARHLEVDANLPDLVLQLVRDPQTDFSPGVSDRAKELARAYAIEHAAPDHLLVGTDSSNDEDEDGTGDDEGSANQAAKTHNKQLLNYLSRTRRVKGPSRDLIYQQSTGTVLGLDGNIALAIEAAAEDGDIDALQRHVSGLDEDGQMAALELLSQHIRTGLGVAGPNTARSLLLLLERMPSLPTVRVVDTVCESISVMHDEDTDLLDEETIESAWVLAKSGADIGAASLRSLVVTVAADKNQWDTAPEFLLNDAVIALDAAPGAASAYVADVVVSEDGEDARTRLFALPDDDLLAVLIATRHPMTDHLNKAVTARNAWDAEQKAASAAPATPAAASPATAKAEPAEAAPEPLDPSGILNSLVEHAKIRETPIQHQILRLLLSIDDMRARNAAIALIPSTEPVSEEGLATAILGSANRRTVSDMPPWLRGIAPSAVTGQHVGPITSLCQKIWDARPKPTEIEAALAALEPIRSVLPPEDRPLITDYALGKVDFWARTNEEATELLDQLARLRAFERAGLADPTRIATALVDSLRDTLANNVPVASEDEPLYEYVATQGVAAMRAAPPDQEILDGILAEATASPWLGEVARTEVVLAFVEATGIQPDQTAHFPKASTIADLAYNYGSTASRPATLWVNLAAPAPDDLAPLYERLRAEDAITLEFAGASEFAQQTWDHDQREQFVRRYLDGPESPVPGDADLKVIGLASLDDTRAAHILSERFAAATNNQQRQSVISLWKSAQITEDVPRRHLIEKIIFGLLDLHIGKDNNASAVELALNALDDLGEPLPWGVKGALGERMKSAIADSQPLRDKALKVMPPLGYQTAAGWFGRNKHVDFEAD